MLVPLLFLFSAAIELEEDSIRLECDPRNFDRHAGADGDAVLAQFLLGPSFIEFPLGVDEDALLASRQWNLAHRDFAA
jgi:hypothetical protein